MTRTGPPLLLIAVLCQSWTLRAQDPAVPPTTPRAGDLESSCRSCHPGSVRGLLQSQHAPLLQRSELGGKLCASCHGDLSAHATSAARPAERELVHAAAVAATACAVCHPAAGYRTALGAHALRAGPPLPERNAHAAADARTLLDIERHDTGSGYQWSGLLEAGYRIAHVSGSLERYRTDVDLDPGARLRSAELNGRGDGGALLQLLRVSTHGIGDSHWDAAARIEHDESFAASAEQRRDAIHYFAGGDWHHVDRSDRSTDYDVTIDVARELRLFGNFGRHDSDSFWLTNRIGSQDLAAQSTITGVQSPRQSRGDDLEVGLTADIDGWRTTAAFDWLGDQNRDRWSFARPAAANPAFPESEDFSSNGSLRGPGGRLLLQRTLGSLQFDLGGRYQELTRRIAGSGTSQGFDIAPFDTVTTSNASGSARTLLLDGSATLQLSSCLALVADAHWRDHREQLDISQTEVTTFPTLGTVTTVTFASQPETAQRLFEGAAAFDFTPSAGLDLTLGWGFARQWLHVPDLQAGDNDFLAGSTQDDGVLAGVEWRPDAQWTAKARWQDYGEDGVSLHELVEDRAHRVDLSLGWKDETFYLTPFCKWRRAENSISSYHRESTAAGLTFGLRHSGLEWNASYTFARVDSRSLTSFWFDPPHPPPNPPDPTPTLVGFAGDTHTITATLGIDPDAVVHWELGAAWTRTTGSFDVSLLDWRADLRWQLTRTAATGVELHELRYQQADGLGNYSADLLFVYWRQTW
ncbi:MAG TPA: hypothetical protein VK348_15320 [Planctomycetota bacterium]|nr:hypothetical protein [Planctomycetota bacterium]